MVKPQARSQSIVEENLAYYEASDLFQFWIGPSTDEKDPHYEELMAAIAKVFQSSNKIKECIDRHRNALVGKKPHWYFADLAGNRVEDDTASVAELLLQRWIDRQYRLAISSESALTNAIAEATKNMLVTGRGYLRLWSPKRFRNSIDPITRVALHSPHPDSVVIHRDDDGFTDSIEYHYTVKDVKRVEVQRIDEATNFTIFTTLDEQEVEIEEETIALDLGGKYSVYEMRSPSLVTDSVKRAQNAINFALTMMPRNIEVAGFRERLILGAQPPGRWEDDKFYPDNEFRVGPGQTAFLQGAPLHDEMGQLKGYTNPSVYSADPVSPQTFIDTAQAFSTNIYDDFSQTHLLGSDLQLSGISRVQSRQDFQTKLGDHNDIVAAAIAGAYGSALMMLTQDSIETYRNLDIVVQLRLNASDPTPEERNANREDYKAGLRSRTTAMAASGIDDPDSEQSLIEEEERARTVVEDTANLLVSGAIDQQTAEATLRSRRVLAGDTNSSDRTNEVLNGN